MRAQRINSSIIGVIILIGLSLSSALYASGTAAQTTATYFKAPLLFERNEGQSAAGVDFVTHGKGFVLHLSSTSAIFALKNERITMQLADANASAKAVAIEPLQSTVNYFMGNDPSKWHTGIPTFGKARYPQIYRGIDVLYYGNGEEFEYDFVVAPGADPNQIALSFPEAQALNVDNSGDLFLTGKYGTLTFQKPFVYQQVNGRRRHVAGKYAIIDNQVRFELGSYDSRLPLIIDPTLKFANYLGGSNFDQVIAVTADASSNAYVTGRSQSTDFKQSKNAYQPSILGTQAAFVTKLNSGGTVVFSTFFGGPDSGSVTQGNGIALDGVGNIYITGRTSANSLPTTGGQTQKGGVNTSNGGPVTGINTFVSDSNFLQVDTGAISAAPTTGGSGTGLTVNLQVNGSGGATTKGPATFVSIADGGTGYKVGDHITVSALGGTATFNVVSVAFPGSDRGTGFVTQFNSTGGFVNSTYLTGDGVNTSNCSSGDEGDSIAVHSASGNIYVTGFTDSSVFAKTAMGIGNCRRAFVAALNFNQNGFMLDAKAFGGLFPDAGKGVTVDPGGNIYATGSLYNGSSQQLFVAKLTYSAQTGLTVANGWPLLFGGSADSIGNAITADIAGNVYIGGETKGPAGSLITANALQQNFGGAGSSHGDGLILKLDPSGNVLYGSYLGGSSDDYITGIGVDPKGNVSVAGSTLSNPSLPNPFPTTNALPAANGGTYSGGLDVFVARFNSAFTSKYYATYLGGSVDDFALGLAVVPSATSNNTLIVGSTTSKNFAGTTRSGTGNENGFVASIGDLTPSQLKFNVTSLTASAGAPISNFQVSIQDASGATVTSASSFVTVSVGTGATITGTNPVRAVSGTGIATGIAAFSGLSIATPGNYTLVATDTDDGTTPAQIPLTITQPALCFTAPLPTTPSGFTISDIQVALKNDASCTGNPIQQAGVTVSIAVASGASTALTGTLTATTATNGIATFSGLSMSPAGNYTLKVSAAGYTSATSPITITSPVHPFLCFTGQPQDTPAGASIPSVKVTLTDTTCAGAVIAQSGVPVTISIGTSTANGVLSGPPSVNTVSGVATFNGLSINVIGTYTLKAAAPSLGLNAESSSFKIVKVSAGIYLTSAQCNALNMSGNTYTDSFDSGLGSYAATKSNTHGDISVVGSADLDGNATVNGVIYTVHPTVGDCRHGNGIDISGHAGATGGYLPLVPTTFPLPPAVTPGTTDVDVKANQVMTLNPGNYDDIKLSGHAVLTLTPGVYNIDTITLTGGSQIVLTGAVTLNLAGTGNRHPLDMSGGSILNLSQVPANFLVNYAGSHNLDLSGQSDAYGVIYAPNADVKISGQGDWFGSMVAGTLTMTGKAGVHIDRRLGQ